MYSFKHIHNYINKLRKTSLSFSSFATFYLAFRNKAIQRKVKKVITVFMKINEGIFITVPKQNIFRKLIGYISN